SDAWTWLHEVGHFVGLEHTSEEDGVSFDPLADTPECRGRRTPRCGDTKNLMIPGWWPDQTLPEVSPSQRAIFQAAPVYRLAPPGAVRGAARGDHRAALEVLRAASGRSGATLRCRRTPSRGRGVAGISAGR